MARRPISTKFSKASGSGVRMFIRCPARSLPEGEVALATLQQVAIAAKQSDDFALIMIGHGAFDNVEYKFDLVGPDISAMISLPRL